MSPLRPVTSLLFFLLISAGAMAADVPATPPAQIFNAVPAALQGIGIDQNLNGQVPMNLPFTDEAGKTVHLADYLNGKPAVLVLAYYNCPKLCTYVLNGVGETLSKMTLKLGADYQVVTVSIDPKETPALAASKKASYVSRFVPEHGDGWHFLTGSQDSITRLANAAGYHFKLDPKTGQFNHATSIMVLTPEGKLSHYFMGIQYSARDLRLALVAASHGAIGNPVDKLLIYCCNVDLSTGKYTASIWKFMQFIGVGSVLILAGLIAILFRYEQPA